MNIGLRSVTVEPLPNEDQVEEEQAADNKAKPVTRGLFNKAKAITDGAFNRGKKMMAGDPIKGLTKALGPVRAALRHWGEIKAVHDARCDLSAYTKHLGKAQAQFAESHSPEDHGKVFLASAVLKERQTEVNIAQRCAYGGSLESEWILFPDVRDNIKKACALKIEATKIELERVRASEKAHLGPKHDANDSPLVKEQANKVAMWEQQLTRLNTRMTLYEPVLEAQRYLEAARLLLEGDESAGKKFVHKDDGGIYELVRVDPIKNPDLAEFENTHHLRSAIGGKSWSGSQANFEKCFKRL
jgi:hypothetical protein